MSQFCSNIFEAFVSYRQRVQEVRKYVIENFSEDVYKKFEKYVYQDEANATRDYEARFDEKFRGVSGSGSMRVSSVALNNDIKRRSTLRLDSKEDFERYINMGMGNGK